MIPQDLLPQVQEELKQRLRQYFLLNCLILDYVEKGPTSLYVGKVDFTPGLSEYRVWTTGIGKATEDDQVLYLYKGEDENEAQEIFLEQAYDNQYLPETDQLEDPERNHGAQVYVTEDLTEESPYVSDEAIDEYEDLLDLSKQDFIPNARCYDYTSDLVSTYVVGYVGVHEDDPFAEWRIWCTEGSPTSPQAEFISTGLTKEEALSDFNHLLVTKGLI